MKAEAEADLLQVEIRNPLGGVTETAHLEKGDALKQSENPPESKEEDHHQVKWSSHHAGLG